MIDLNRRALFAGLALLPIAGCATRPPVFPPIDYTARADGLFVVPAVGDGQVPAELRRQLVEYPTDRPVGSLVIVPDQRALYLVLRNGYALRYSVAVGRNALSWRGEAEIGRKEVWPSWTPPASDAASEPTAQAAIGAGTLSVASDAQTAVQTAVPTVPGGPDNPLGARALYLRTVATGMDEGLSIHGTPSGDATGRSAEAGGYRMINQDIMDLYDRVAVGARVLVM